MNETIKKINVNDFEVVSIKKQIKEVQDYFKTKILNGDYDIESLGQYLMRISIDGHMFHVWIASLDIPQTIGLHEMKQSFIDLDFTREEKLHLQKMLKPIINKHRREKLLKEKEAELDQLKKSLEL